MLVPCMDIFLWYAKHLFRKHVFQDLQPYVCTFPSCPKADELYDSQREWFNHEVQLHHREWYCDACLKSFSQKALFQEHISVRHPELGTKGHFEAVIQRCERAIITDIVCPLCGINSTLQTLEKHLGLHLQEVALFTLPHLGEGSSDTKSDELDSSSKSAGGYSSPVQQLPVSSLLQDSSKVDSDNKQSTADHPIFSPPAAEEMKCICSYQHDDGFTVFCGKCKDQQHGVCMGIDPGHVPDVYECFACNPGAHQLEIETAINVQENFLRSYQKKQEKERIEKESKKESKELSPPKKPWRLKVYELRNNDWLDRGTGYCTGHMIDVREPTRQKLNRGKWFFQSSEWELIVPFRHV